GQGEGRGVSTPAFENLAGVLLLQQFLRRLRDLLLRRAARLLGLLAPGGAFDGLLYLLLDPGHARGHAPSL
ncbi:MAG: hypothetical protein AVDCRST_MAG22-1853, partial [uncultured Rubrobacteraceae bacterium]